MKKKYKQIQQIFQECENKLIEVTHCEKCIDSGVKHDVANFFAYLAMFQSKLEIKIEELDKLNSEPFISGFEVES